MTIPADEFATFVVRLSRVAGGRLSGVVERVRTGEKARFNELDALGAVIARMLDHHREPETPGPSCV
jgi:hypothetical protein